MHCIELGIDIILIGLFGITQAEEPSLLELLLAVFVTVAVEEAIDCWSWSYDFEWLLCLLFEFELT